MIGNYSIKNDMNRFRLLLMASLYFLMPVSAMVLLTGCGENENIISASRLTSGQVTLSWNDVPQAVAYNVHLSTTPGVTALNAFKIYWSNKKGVTKRNGTKISNVNSPHTIAGLKKGSTYYFVVTAVNASGESDVSDSISFTVDK
jgi:hypothetical protein